MRQLTAGACFHGFYRNYVKRAIDLFIAAIALIISLPVIILSATLISLETPGSPLFFQKRIGQNGKPFYIYKIRTMYVGSDKHGFKTDESDPRVTRLGRILREKKIDELLQLWNILRGDMSLIGPRPLSVDESNFVSNELGYSENYPGFHPKVRPGLTGLEQIYRIHPLVYKERFDWNNHYESKLSFLLDLKVLYATILMCRLVCAAAICGGIIELAILTGLLTR
jgi:lipopolysaccharide/colanic/teichoic acid biosynthesis glycosyltransferase